jgi:hypothetical protein
MRGGVESAAGAIERGMERVPFGIDVATGSPFLDRLSPSGHGTIALQGQLDPRVQSAATRLMDYGDTHVGILSDPAALRGLPRVLDETTGNAKPEKTTAR